MFKIPDFSLVQRLCKQAGLDLVSARNHPRTLVSGDLRHFDTTVRCAAHYAGATLNRTYRWRELRFRGGTSETHTCVVSKCKSESSKAHRSVPTSCLDLLEWKLELSQTYIFCQSAERLHVRRLRASRKEQPFSLSFISWITQFVHGSFHRFQKGQVTSKKHKLSRKYIWRRSSQVSPPAAVKLCYDVTAEKVQHKTLPHKAAQCKSGDSVSCSEKLKILNDAFS